MSIFTFSHVSLAFKSASSANAKLTGAALFAASG